MTISPWPTCITMLRASSEIAVAMSVGSGRENPSRCASARPSARAVTRSASAAISTRISPLSVAMASRPAVEQGQGLVQVQGGPQRLHVEPELDHGDGDVRLDAYEHGLRSAQPGGDRDLAQRPRHEGVDDLQRRDVHDEAAAA